MKNAAVIGDIHFRKTRRNHCAVIPIDLFDNSVLVLTLFIFSLAARFGCCRNVPNHFHPAIESQNQDGSGSHCGKKQHGVKHPRCLESSCIFWVCTGACASTDQTKNDCQTQRLNRERNHCSLLCGLFGLGLFPFQSEPKKQLSYSDGDDNEYEPWDGNLECPCGNVRGETKSPANQAMFMKPHNLRGVGDLECPICFLLQAPATKQTLPCSVFSVLQQ